MIKQVWAAAIYTQGMWHLLGARKRSFHGPLCAILLLALIVWFSPFLLFVFAQALREKQRFSSESLVQLNYTVKAFKRAASLPPLLLFPSHEHSRNNPAEASGNKCPKTGPGIASGRPLQAEKHPRGQRRGWKRRRGCARSSSGRSGPPARGQDTGHILRWVQQQGVRSSQHHQGN